MTKSSHFLRQMHKTFQRPHLLLLMVTNPTRAALLTFQLFDELCQPKFRKDVSHPFGSCVSASAHLHLQVYFHTQRAGCAEEKTSPSGHRAEQRSPAKVSACWTTLACHHTSGRSWPHWLTHALTPTQGSQRENSGTHH